MPKKKVELEKPKRKAGQPPFKYTQELAEEICNAIANGSDSVKTLCKNNSHWPSHETIWLWIRTNKQFSDQYAQAKRAQAEFLVDELLDTAKSSTDSESASCNRLIIDTSKWLACKLIPKVYGDRAAVEEIKANTDELVKDMLQRKAKLDAENKKEY